MNKKVIRVHKFKVSITTFDILDYNIKASLVKEAYSNLFEILTSNGKVTEGLIIEYCGKESLVFYEEVNAL